MARVFTVRVTRAHANATWEVARAGPASRVWACARARLQIGSAWRGL